MLGCVGLALLSLQAVERLLDLALYLLFADLLLAFLLVLLLLRILVAGVVDIHLVLLDTLAFALLLRLLLRLLTLLTFFALFLFGFLAGMRSLVDRREVDLANHFGLCYGFGLMEREHLGLLLLGRLGFFGFGFLLRFGRYALGFGLSFCLEASLLGRYAGFLCLTACLLCRFLSLTGSLFGLTARLFLRLLLGIEVDLAHYLRLWQLGFGGRFGFFYCYRRPCHALLALLGLTVCLELDGHVLVEFLSEHQVEIVVDTHVGIGRYFMPLFLAECNRCGHSDIEFLASFD